MRRYSNITKKGVRMLRGTPGVFTSSQSACAEERLFQAVVLRAVLDACGHTGGLDKKPNKYNRNSLHDRAVRDARDWFQDSGRDMTLVFDYAGVELEPVRHKVVAAYQEELQ